MPRQPSPQSTPIGDTAAQRTGDIGTWLRWASVELAASSTSARLDAEMLLSQVLDAPRTHLYAWPERRVSGPAAARFQALIARRREGEPVAYLTGYQAFHGLDLVVTPDTLIPRPETEALVDFAPKVLEGRTSPRVLDLGTGCGAIALALAARRRDARVDAVEINAKAAEIARGNALRLDLPNVTVFTGSWFEPLGRRRYDLILANPPYVAAAEAALTSPETRYEPRSALYAAQQGSAALKAIVSGAAAHLTDDGWLALEHGFRQGPAVRAMLDSAGFTTISTQRDLAGHERISHGRMPAAAPHGDEGQDRA